MTQAQLLAMRIATDVSTPTNEKSFNYKLHDLSDHVESYYLNAVYEMPVIDRWTGGQVSGDLPFVP